MTYFTDRNLGPMPRVATDIDEAVRRGIVGLLHTRANDGSFGLEYPEPCPDGRGPSGTDTQAPTPPDTLENAVTGRALYFAGKRVK